MINMKEIRKFLNVGYTDSKNATMYEVTVLIIEKGEKNLERLNMITSVQKENRLNMTVNIINLDPSLFSTKSPEYVEVYAQYFYGGKEERRKDIQLTTKTLSMFMKFQDQYKDINKILNLDK